MKMSIQPIFVQSKIVTTKLPLYYEKAKINKGTKNNKHNNQCTCDKTKSIKIPPATTILVAA